MSKTVFVQNWEERERGWGSRPDGFTIHVDKEQLDKYVAWYHKTFNNKSAAPDEYTTTDGSPIEIEVSDELYAKIKTASEFPIKGKPTNAVHGKERFFSTTPMRELKEEDIAWSSDLASK
jgi:hypothetical protein